MAEVVDLRPARSNEIASRQMKGRTRVVPPGAIEYITASGTYTELHVGSDRYGIRQSMHQLEERRRDGDYGARSVAR